MDYLLNFIFTSKKAKSFYLEILAVIIGVLIAFWVDSLGEHNNKNTLRKFYHEELRENLKKDLAQLNLVIKSQQNNQKTILDFINKLSSKEHQNLDELFSKTITNETFYPTMGAYRAMIAEGSLSLIINKNVTSAIVDLYEFNYERSIYLGSVLDTEIARMMWEVKEFYSLSDLKFYDIDELNIRKMKSLLDHRLAYIGLYLNQVEQTFAKIQSTIKILENESI